MALLEEMGKSHKLANARAEVAELTRIAEQFVESLQGLAMACFAGNIIVSGPGQNLLSRFSGLAAKFVARAACSRLPAKRGIGFAELRFFSAIMVRAACSLLPLQPMA